MPTSTREALSWSEDRWNKTQEAIKQAVARTAKARQVVPTGPEKIGEKSVVVPQINAAAPFAYIADLIASPIWLYVNVDVDDQHIDDENAVNRLVGAAAAQLGALEDIEVVQGPPPPPGAAPAPAAPAAPLPQSGRLPRKAGLTRAQLNLPVGPAFTRIPPPAGGAGPAKAVPAPAAPSQPNGQQLLTAITTAMGQLESAGRPGQCGLLIHVNLLGVLGTPPIAGAAPLIQQVEQVIGSSEIVGTSALDGTYNPGRVAAILFRLEPTAVDLVHTMLPTLTYLGRNAGVTNLRVEEEIVVRILDQTAIHHIEY